MLRPWGKKQAGTVKAAGNAISVLALVTGGVDYSGIVAVAETAMIFKGFTVHGFR